MQPADQDRDASVNGLHHVFCVSVVNKANTQAQGWSMPRREQRQKWCRRIFLSCLILLLSSYTPEKICNHRGGRGEAFTLAARQIELSEIARQVHLLVNAAGLPRLKPFSIL